MIIDCISDLHGFYPELEGGDLLIVSGDLTSRDTFEQHSDFKTWLYKQNYRKKIVVAGNHDNHFVGTNPGKYVFSSYNTKTDEQTSYADYLLDSGTEFEGLKIWGSPWTKTFEGMNPHCKAFTVDTEEELDSKFSLIPDDTNILITHSPSFGNYDWIKNRNGSIGPSVGSVTLWMKMLTIVPNLKLHVTGHIHEAYGNSVHRNGIHLVNCSYVNERYEPVNKPIRVIL